MAQRQVYIEDEEEERKPPAPVPAPTPIVFHGSVVRVQIIDDPPRQPHDGACRCEACRAGCLTDWAELFL